MTEADRQYTFGILTLSDKGSRGEREDTSGALLCELFEREGYIRKAYKIIPDQQQLISDNL